MRLWRLAIELCRLTSVQASMEVADAENYLRKASANAGIKASWSGRDTLTGRPV